MTLKEFIKEYDREGILVLLEGKRKVREEDKDKLIQLGRILKTKTKFMIFRSGNAEGSDRLFFEGAASEDNNRLQVVTPYSGHYEHKNVAYDTMPLDSMTFVKDSEAVYLSRRNKKTRNLIDKYVDGGRDKYSMKAAYILRDTVKVLGYENAVPASCGIFYDDPDNPGSGGTGHTMDVCREKKIPVIDQTVWFGWLEQ